MILSYFFYLSSNFITFYQVQIGQILYLCLSCTEYHHCTYNYKQYGHNSFQIDYFIYKYKYFIYKHEYFTYQGNKPLSPIIYAGGSGGEWRGVDRWAITLYLTLAFKPPHIAITLYLTLYLTLAHIGLWSIMLLILLWFVSGVNLG